MLHRTALKASQVASTSIARRSLSSVAADFYRGGTSKALFLQPKDLPQDKEKRHALFRAAIGSPDPYARQLDGMGGGISSTSKICLVEESSRDDADVDYTFVQIGVKDKQVDYASNCGNMVSAVGPYAIDKGFKHELQGDGTALVRIYNTNTKKIIHATFPTTKDGKPEYRGDYEIDGVAGTASKIALAFVRPGGSRTGKLLPTGKATDTLSINGLGEVTASLIDCANPCVFVRASDVGMAGDELPDAVSAKPTLVQQLEQVRQKAGVAMGIFASEEKAAQSRSVPKVCIVSKPKDYVSLSGEQVKASGADVMVRVMSSGDPHKAIPITAALCVAAAARVPGSLVDEVVSGKGAGKELVIAHASGCMGVNADVTQSPTGEVEAQSGTILRTARKLFEGRVFY